MEPSYNIAPVDTLVSEARPRGTLLAPSVPSHPLERGPDHYKRWTIQPLEFCAVNKIDFVRGNIIKYILRYDAKGGLDDLNKAQHYLDVLKEEAKKECAHDY